MAEGPEYAVLRNGLTNYLEPSCTLKSASILSGRYVRHGGLSFDSILSLNVSSIETQGKLLWFEFERSDKILVFTLGMTGKFSLVEDKFSRIRFFFGDQEVIFSDVRNFGTVRILDRNWLNRKLFQIGVDPLQSPVTIEYVTDYCNKFPDHVLCEALLNQSFIAGCGNYLRAEIMYRAKVDPWISLGSLSAGEKIRLVESINSTFLESLDCRGNTIKDYTTLLGEKGTFSERLCVYNRKQDQIGNEVRRDLDSNDRAVFWCPAVQ
jgi:DNA-formamidopyrimidine glycosylase